MEVYAVKQSTLGTCIRALRMQNNMTQARLAELLGVSDRDVSGWENGLSYPDIALFPKLAGILKTDRDGLLREYMQSVLARNAQEKMRTENYSFAGRRILVADDMEINRRIAAEILKQTGAVTEFAENGQICLEKIKNAPPGRYDLILMDITMPVMDGLEAARTIRQLQDPEKAAIPIIAMTTNNSAEDRDAAYAAGMNAFEEKPVMTDQLYETIAGFLHPF